ncbi:MAG: hypothetical protein ABI921_14590, partial [Panacibacter sp.]
EWFEKNIFLELVIWEDFLDAVSETRLQDEYNKAISECDIFVMLFFTKVGKYTEEEFTKALEQFKATKKPAVYTYFKDAPISTGSINKDVLSLLKFKKKLDKIQHFYTSYQNTDELKLKFNQQLDKLFSNGQMGNEQATKDTSLVDLVTNIVDKYSNVANQQQDGRSAYKDFIEPALADFEKVHQNYLETFLNYKRVIENQNIPLAAGNPILQKIEEDMLFSIQLRSKPEALKELQDNAVFGSFITSIVNYTNGGETMKRVLLTGRRGMNVARTYAIAGLKNIFETGTDENEKKIQALALIDRIVSELQYEYDQVMKAHIKLKKQVLIKH